MAGETKEVEWETKEVEWEIKDPCGEQGLEWTWLIYLKGLLREVR